MLDLSRFFVSLLLPIRCIYLILILLPVVPDVRATRSRMCSFRRREKQVGRSFRG